MTEAADIAALQREADQRFIGFRETCTIAGFSKSTIRRKIQRGEFPHPVIQDGTTVRFDYSEVMAWRAEQFKKREQRLAAPRRGALSIAA